MCFSDAHFGTQKFWGGPFLCTIYITGLTTDITKTTTAIPSQLMDLSVKCFYTSRDRSEGQLGAFILKAIENIRYKTEHGKENAPHTF